MVSLARLFQAGRHRRNVKTSRGQTLALDYPIKRLEYQRGEFRSLLGKHRPDIWRVWQELNLRPLASEANTLSTELQTRGVGVSRKSPEF